MAFMFLQIIIEVVSAMLFFINFIVDVITLKPIENVFSKYLLKKLVCDCVEPS